MPAVRYRIHSPTFAFVLEGERHVTHTVPKGATVSVESDVFDANKLVDILWDGKSARMFGQDLKSRGVKID